MAIVKQSLESRLDEQRRERARQETKRHLVFYVIAQESAFRVRFDDVTMTPAVKWPGELSVLKHARRIVSGVFGNPARVDEA